MCQECNRFVCPCQCPNYISPKTSHHCSICGEGIAQDEEYIINLDSEFAHFECFDGMRDLLKWLGHKILTMEDSI